MHAPSRVAPFSLHWWRGVIWHTGVILVCVWAVAQITCKKPDPEKPPTCLDYATAVVGMCYDATRTSEGQPVTDCATQEVFEVAYNACNITLDNEQAVCIPYRVEVHADEWQHACSGYVEPPAPTNWRGTATAP